MKMKLYIFRTSYITIMLVLLSYNFLPFYYPLNTKAIGMEVLRIAHAGGGIFTDTYTNSYEAIENNIEKGFIYFEIDFLLTSDQYVVCAHDWNNSFSKNISKKITAPPSLKEFNNLVINNGNYTNCTLDGLVGFLDSNKNIKIITDSKDNNLLILKKISEKIPNYSDRIIPQIYNPNNFKKVKNMGYKSIIWTLYRYMYNNNMVLYNIKKFTGEIAITMPEQRAKSNLPALLKSINIPSYTHTINNKHVLKELNEKYFITEIYTDYLSPK